MQPEEIQKIISKIRMWTRRDKRAPHKPLPILYLLRLIGKTKDQLILFKQVNKSLTPLPMRFSTARKSNLNNYQFTHMDKNDIWVLSQPLNTKEDCRVLLKPVGNQYRCCIASRCNARWIP